MKFTKQGMILSVAFAAVVILAVVFVFNRPTNEERPTPSTQTEGTSVKLPETVFDASYALGDSGITIQYPAKGFYGLGANVVQLPAEDGVIGSIHIETTDAADATRKAQFVTMDAGVSQAKVDSLEAFVATIPKDSYEGFYVASNGKYVTVNGHRYFMYRVTEDVTVWRAFSLDGDRLVGASLAYKRGDAPASLAAYMHNDDLFVEILNGIVYQ